MVPDQAGYRYVYDPARPESILARARVDAVVERLQADIRKTEGLSSSPAAADEGTVTGWKAGSHTWQTNDSLVTEPGNRYIDFLLPGLMGMNLMGGGLWGVGFVIVDMRIRKLLKRLLATPMNRSHFLLAVLCTASFLCCQR